MIRAQDLLAAHPFLSGMSQEQLAKLSFWAHRSQFHRGTRLFSEGGRADRFWLIRDGEVTLFASVPGQGDVVIETLGAGAVLGWSWLFPPYRWHFSATATAPTLTVELDGPGVLRLCGADPELGYELTLRFMQVVVERLQATRARMLEGLHLEQTRLASAVIERLTIEFRSSAADPHPPSAPCVSRSRQAQRPSSNNRLLS